MASFPDEVNNNDNNNNGANYTNSDSNNFSSILKGKNKFIPNTKAYRYWIKSGYMHILHEGIFLAVVPFRLSTQTV